MPPPNDSNTTISFNNLRDVPIIPSYQSSPYELDRIIRDIRNCGVGFHRDGYGVGYMVDRILSDIREHIQNCKIFNGLSIARSMEDIRGRNRSGRGGVRCSCGYEIPLDGNVWSFRYMSANIEDIVQDINHRYFDETRGDVSKKIIDESGRKERSIKRQKIELIEQARSNIKNSISSLEIE